jgi:hypothetical protein
MGVKIKRAGISGFCIFLFACANASVNTNPIGSGSSSGGSSGGSGAGGDTGGGGTISLKLDGSVVKPPSFSGDVRSLRCPEAGTECKCMNILSLGKTAGYGANSGSSDNTDAFITYMNTKSNAKVVLQTTYVPLTSDYLANFDLIILQSLGDGQKGSGPFWASSYNTNKITDSDVSNLETWVRNGGAIISMTGYGAETAEVDPLNKLLKFAGISYNTDDIFVSGDGWDYCRWSAVPFSGWTDNDLSLTNPTSSETTKLTAVGMFHGRSIKCSDPACVTIGESGSLKVAVARKLEKGRIFAFADEWVTYTSQWGLDETCVATPDMCKWDDPVQNSNCIGHTAKALFKVPQFWYNVIRWSVPEAECFAIKDPGVTIF